MALLAMAAVVGHAAGGSAVGWLFFGFCMECVHTVCAMFSASHTYSTYTVTPWHARDLLGAGAAGR